MSRHELPELNMPLFWNYGFTTGREAFPLKYHRDPGHEITVMVKGEGVWLIDNGPTLNVPGGTLGLTQPQVLHRGRHDVIEPCQLIWLCIDFEADHREQFLSLPPEELERLKSIFDQAGNCTAPGSRHLIQLCKQLIHIPAIEESTAFWCRTLLQQIMVETGRILGQTHETQGQDQSLIHNTEQWMKEHCEQPGLTVLMMAEAMGYSQRSFFRIFTQIAGMSPADFILRYRLGRSQKMLLDTDLSITDIALNCGFSSSQNFARSFRKFTNHSPSTFRARYLGETERNQAV